MSVIAWFMRNKPYLSLLPSSRIITYFPRSFHGHVKVVVKDALFNVFGTSRILSSYWSLWKENKSENVCVSYFIIFNLSSIENNNYWINYFFCQIAWNLSQHITLKKKPHSGSIYQQKQILAPSLMVKEEIVYSIEAMTEKNTKTTEYKYLKLNELQANTTVNVFGVVKFARPPTKTRGSGKWLFCCW